MKLLFLLSLLLLPSISQATRIEQCGEWIFEGRIRFAANQWSFYLDENSDNQIRLLLPKNALLTPDLNNLKLVATIEISRACEASECNAQLVKIVRVLGLYEKPRVAIRPGNSKPIKLKPCI